MLNANPTKVVLLKNMFDPSGADETSDPRFFDELKEDEQYKAAVQALADAKACLSS